MTKFWITSIVGEDINEATKTLKNILVCDSVANSTAHLIKFPQIKIGTLDNLIHLLDQLPSLNLSAKNLINKLADTLENCLDNEMDQSYLQVNSTSVAQCLLKFEWNNIRYKPNQSIHDVIENIQKDTSQIEGLLRTKNTQYSSIKSKLTQMDRKQTGNLSTKNLNEIITKDQCVTDSEYLTTLFVAIPKNLQKEWLNKYETINEKVVPRSTFKVTNDEEYILYSVVVFKKEVDNFKKKCRDLKFVVRDFNFDKNQMEQESKEHKKMQDLEHELWRSLVQLCTTSFEEAVINYMHLCVLHAFVESILRYGLPPKYFGAVFTMQNEGKVYKAMEKYYRQFSKEFKPPEKSSETEDVGEHEDFTSFVRVEFDWNH